MEAAMLSFLFVWLKKNNGCYLLLSVVCVNATTTCQTEIKSTRRRNWYGASIAAGAKNIPNTRNRVSWTNMHRNTFLLVSLLAVFAALVVGVNFGKRIGPRGDNQAQQISVPVNPSPQPTPSIALSISQRYTNQYCGVSFDYPSTLQKVEGASNSAVFAHTQIPSESVLFTCQKDIPKPPLTGDRIESLTISSVSAKLYHDSSEKDGVKVDKLIVRNPYNGFDIFLAGTGKAFTQIISSITFLR